MDLSLLLLVTPMMPPPVDPPPGPPGVLGPTLPPDVCGPVDKVVAPPGPLPRIGAAPGWVLVPALPACTPPCVFCPTRIGAKSSLVMGSLYFLRRNFSLT